MKIDIKNYLIYTVEEFPFKDIAQITYSYDQELDIHFIIVSPSNVMTDNSKIASWERKLWKKLYEDYPESDVIVTDKKDTDLFNLIEIVKN